MVDAGVAPRPRRPRPRFSDGCLKALGELAWETDCEGIWMVLLPVSVIVVAKAGGVVGVFNGLPGVALRPRL